MSESNYADFGSWVKARRAAQQRTQQQLSVAIHFSVETIRKVEHRDYPYPSDDLINALAKELEIFDEDYPEFYRLAKQSKQSQEPSEQTPIYAVPVVDVVPISPKSRNRLRFGRILAGITPFLASVVAAILGGLQTSLAAEVGIIMLTSSGNQPLTLQTRNQTISAHDEITFLTPIGVGEMVTVIFKIQNADTHPIRIETLSGGAQGPNEKKADWLSPQSPFPSANNILLQPGEIYEYKQSRQFFAPGNYFVEPTFQDALGHWGGIQPFTRINFTVK